MDLTFSEREAAFRDELRGWLEENPPDAKPENGSEAALSEWRRAWQRRLYEEIDSVLDLVIPAATPVNNRHEADQLL